MNRWFSFIILLFLVPLQTTWLTGLSLDSIRPDLGLILVFFVGFYGGERQGLLIGLLAGGLLDLFSGGPLGSNLVSKALLGWGSGVLGRLCMNVTGGMTMIFVFGLSLLSGIITYLIQGLAMETIPFGGVFRWTILPEALYNTLVAAVVFWLGLRRLRVRTAIG